MSKKRSPAAQARKEERTQSRSKNAAAQRYNFIVNHTRSLANTQREFNRLSKSLGGGIGSDVDNWSQAAGRLIKKMLSLYANPISDAKSLCYQVDAVFSEHFKENMSKELTRLNSEAIGLTQKYQTELTVLHQKDADRVARANLLMNLQIGVIGVGLGGLGLYFLLSDRFFTVRCHMAAARMAVGYSDACLRAIIGEEKYVAFQLAHP